MCNNKHPDTIRLEWALDHPSKFRDLVENELWPRYTADALANKRLIDDTLDKARHMDDPLYEEQREAAGLGFTEDREPLKHPVTTEHIPVIFKPSQELLDKLGDDMRH